MTIGGLGPNGELTARQRLIRSVLALGEVTVETGASEAEQENAERVARRRIARYGITVEECSREEWNLEMESSGAARREEALRRERAAAAARFAPTPHFAPSAYGPATTTNVPHFAFGTVRVAYHPNGTTVTFY